MMEQRPGARRPGDQETEQPRQQDGQRMSGNGQANGTASLVRPEVAGSFRERWTQVQSEFVDEPRRALEDADALVAEALEEVERSFADERSGLEQQWDRGDEVETEELRLALQRYRSFFERLLAV